MSVREIRKEIRKLEQQKKITTDDIAKIIQRARNKAPGISERVNITSVYGIENKNDLRRDINPSANYKEAFLLFDSDFKDPSRSTGSTFAWNVSNVQVQQTGTIPTVASLRNIVGMRLYPFTMTLIPPIQSRDKVILSPNVMGNYNYSIYIEEFKSQAIYGRGGRNYHFITFPYILNVGYFDKLDEPVTPPNPYVEFVTSGKGNGWFWFQKPIVEFSTITINFGNPWDLITIPTTTRIILPIKFIYDYQEDTIKP